MSKKKKNEDPEEEEDDWYDSFLNILSRKLEENPNAKIYIE